MAARFWLMRHAETAAPNLLHGAESDIGLSVRGRQSAECIAPYFAALRPDAIVSSAMRRAIDTAAPIAEACGLQLRCEPELHERRVGQLSRMPIVPDHPLRVETLRRWMSGDTAFAPAGSESFDDIRDRVVPVFARLAEEFAGRSAVIVAHGAVIKVTLLSLLPGWSASRWRELGIIDNLAVTELVGYEGQWHAIQLPAVPDVVHRVDS